MKRISLVAACMCLWGASAVAQETSETLPLHIFRARVIEIIGSVNYLLDNNGQEANPLAPLNQTVTAARASTQNAQLKELYDKLNEFQKGLGDSLFQSQLNGSASIAISRQIYALEYGLTPRLSFGILVPVLHENITSSFSATTTSQAQLLEKRFKGINDLVNGLKQFEASTPNTSTYATELFTSRGYQVPGDFQISGLGDIELGGKYMYYKNDWMRASTEGGVHLPTTTHPQDYTNILDLGLGETEMGIGIRFYTDFFPTKRWIIGTSLKFAKFLPDVTRMPVPANGDPIPNLPDLTNPETWQNVHRELGASLQSELSTQVFFFNNTASLYGCYQFNMQAQNSFQGNDPTRDYEYIQENTNVVEHHYELGVGYSTIPLYYSHKIPAPFELKAGYNAIFAGKNTPMAKYTRLNLLLYF